MKAIPALIAVLVVSLLVACGGGESTASAKRPGCTAAGIRAALVSFSHAYSRGNVATLDRIFSPEPNFEWYSTDAPGTRLNPEAKRRSTLIPYFERRHRLNDRFTLRGFQFNGNSRHVGVPIGNFQMWMGRRTDGFRGGRWFKVGGKGAATCGEDGVRFIVLTFGTVPAR